MVSGERPEAISILASLRSLCSNCPMRQPSCAGLRERPSDVTFSTLRSVCPCSITFGLSDVSIVVKTSAPLFSRSCSRSTVAAISSPSFCLPDLDFQTFSIVNLPNEVRQVWRLELCFYPCLKSDPAGVTNVLHFQRFSLFPRPLLDYSSRLHPFAKKFRVTLAQF